MLTENLVPVVPQYQYNCGKQEHNSDTENSNNNANVCLAGVTSLRQNVNLTMGPVFVFCLQFVLLFS